MDATETEGLSAEEIALLNEGLDGDGNPKDDTQSTGAAEGGTEGSGAAGAGDEDAAEGGAPAPAPAPTAAEPSPAPQPAEPFVPTFKADVPADAAQQIAALKAEESAALKKLIDGDMEPEEYTKIRDRVEQDVDALKTKALTATIFEQANAQAAEQASAAEWKRAEKAAMAAFEAEGIEYLKKPALLAAYNTHLKALAADKANHDKDSAWYLNEAHKRTKEDLGLTARAPAPSPTPSRGVDKAQIPPTLAAVPAAATATVSGDKFAHLAHLKGAELERAFALLSPAEQEEYLG